MSTFYFATVVEEKGNKVRIKNDGKKKVEFEIGIGTTYHSHEFPHLHAVPHEQSVMPQRLAIASLYVSTGTDPHLHWSSHLHTLPVASQAQSAHLMQVIFKGALGGLVGTTSWLSVSVGFWIVVGFVDWTTIVSGIMMRVDLWIYRRNRHLLQFECFTMIGQLGQMPLTCVGFWNFPKAYNALCYCLSWSINDGRWYTIWCGVIGYLNLPLEERWKSPDEEHQVKYHFVADEHWLLSAIYYPLLTWSW